jgi:hypothetical protein
MDSVRKLKKTSGTLVRVLALVMGTCTAAGIVAIELLAGNFTQLLHILSLSAV